MSDYRIEIQGLLDQISWSPKTDGERRLAEKAVQLADRHQDIEYQLKGRSQLVKAAVTTGFPEKALVAYSFILAIMDEKPEVFKEHMWSFMTLWDYKWVINRLSQFSTISREQIMDTLEDMERRFTAEGGAEESILQYRFKINSQLGNYDVADEVLREINEGVNLSDSLNDCGACFLSSRVSHYVRQGKYDQAIEESAPILEGRETCGEIPEMFYDVLLIPYLLTDRFDDAMELLTKLELEDTARKLDMNAVTIIGHAAAGRHSHALEVLERNWAVMLNVREHKNPFKFRLAARYLLRELAASGQENIKLRLPDDVPFYQASQSYVIADLLQQLDDEINKVREAFVLRDGNDFYHRLEQRVDEIAARYRKDK